MGEFKTCPQIVENEIEMSGDIDPLLVAWSGGPLRYEARH